jgi:hypothetical protein
MVLATTVGTMLAAADASTCEAIGKGRSAVASGITGGCPEALSDDAQVRDNSRLVTTGRLTVPAAAQTCSGPCACRPRPRFAPSSKAGDTVQKSRSERAATAVPGGSGSPVPIARLRGGSTHRSHKRPVAVPKIVPPYDPNDDTTSGDRDDDDDDETSIFLNDDDDDTDAPIISWLEARAPCPIPHECAPVAWTAPPPSSLLMIQRLRC